MRRVAGWMFACVGELAAGRRWIIYWVSVCAKDRRQGDGDAACGKRKGGSYPNKERRGDDGCIRCWCASRIGVGVVAVGNVGSVGEAESAGETMDVSIEMGVCLWDAVY